MGKFINSASGSRGSREPVAPTHLVKGVYCIHDNVSGENGPLVFAISDDAFIRDFGIAFSKFDVPPSLAIQWSGIKLGELIVPNNPHSLPRLVGYECPVPVCSASEAMNRYSDFRPAEPVPDSSAKEDSVNG